MRDEYHCIALDQRGHGDSDWAQDADYSIGAQLADTKGFVDNLGLDKFILVGMSLGAINSLAFAIAHPERLWHLVIIDAGPEMRRPGSSRIRDFVNEVQDTVTVEAIIEKALKFNPRRDPKILRRSLMHNLRQQPDGTWKWKYDTRRFKGLDQERTAPSAPSSPTASPASPARLWWCAAARATSSTRRTGSAWRSGFRRAGW